jgi:photosystem II stability/assembly factor-like uncharacterized protein
MFNASGPLGLANHISSPEVQGMKTVRAFARNLSLILIPLTVLAGCGADGTNPAAVTGPPPAVQSLQWASIQRRPASESLNSIASSDAVSLAVGNGGLILVRISGGDWQEVDRSVDETLRKVVMTGLKSALVLGNSVVLRTVDAGRTWDVVAETPGTFLNDIAVQGDNAVVVGNGTILVSHDTGLTWQPPAASFPSISYQHVAFQTETTISTVASGGNLLRSANGGANWTEVAVGQITETPTDMEFFSEDVGVVALRSPTAILWTSDGGDTWTEVVTFGNGSIADLEKIDGKNMLAILETGQIHATSDAGKTWAFNSLVPSNPLDSNGLSVSGKDWTVVGSIGFVAESKNEGGSWAETSTGRTGSFRSIAFADELTGVAAFEPGPGGSERALRTIDGGATWQSVDPDIKRPNRVVFAGPGVGLLVGGGEVAKSTTAGADWTDITPVPEPGGNLLGAAILNTYVLCGSGSRVFRTTTGGNSWEDLTFETSGTTQFEDVAFFPGTEVAVMVGTLRSFRSENGGVTWAPVNVRARAVACVTADAAVAVGDQILRSPDRGQTWTIVTVPSTALLEVAFADERHGVAAGSEGLLMETLDGGQTWNVVSRQTSVRLNAVAFRNGVSALAGGTGGALLLGETQ